MSVETSWGRPPVAHTVLWETFMFPWERYCLLISWYILQGSKVFSLNMGADYLLDKIVCKDISVVTSDSTGFGNCRHMLILFGEV